MRFFLFLKVQYCKIITNHVRYWIIPFFRFIRFQIILTLLFCWLIERQQLSYSTAAWAIYKIYYEKHLTHNIEDQLNFRVIMTEWLYQNLICSVASNWFHIQHVLRLCWLQYCNYLACYVEHMSITLFFPTLLPS